MTKRVATRIVFAAVVAASLSACGAGERGDVLQLAESGLSPDEIGAQRAAIVNGQPHTGHPAVGAITYGSSLCTATLIGKRAVLTAAHCLSPGRPHYFVAGGRYWPAAAATRHPQYTGASTAENDVAVAMLQDAPPIAPAYISTVPPQQGQEVTLIGMGATTDGGAGSGMKRLGKNQVAFLTKTRIIITGSGGATSNLCFGDSGGPTFATIGEHEVQVGVHSTIAGACGTQGHDMRVDVFAEWIRKTAQGDVSADGLPSPQFDQRAPTVEITRPRNRTAVRQKFELAANVTDDQRIARVDIYAEGKHLASREQAPFVFALELPPGEHDLTVIGHDMAKRNGQAAVRIHVLPLAGFGVVCRDHVDCKSSMCAAYSAINATYCTQTCSATQACPGDALCYAANGRMLCGPPPSLLPRGNSASGDGKSAGADDRGAGGGCAVAAGSSDRSLVVGLLSLLIAAVVMRRRLG